MDGAAPPGSAGAGLDDLAVAGATGEAEELSMLDRRKLGEGGDRPHPFVLDHLAVLNGNRSVLPKGVDDKLSGLGRAEDAAGHAEAAHAGGAARGRFEVNPARGKLDYLDEIAIGRYVLRPGWHWAKDVKPIAGTHSCQHRHVGYVISGSIEVRMDDGTVLMISAGDAYEIPPGHDVRVVGDELFDSVEFTGAEAFGVSPEDLGERVLPQRDEMRLSVIAAGAQRG